MQITLKPDVQKFLEEQVKAGHFSTLDEVLEAAVARLMLDPPADELDEATLDAIDRAEAQFNRDEGIPIDEAFARLRKKHGLD